MYDAKIHGFEKSIHSTVTNGFYRIASESKCSDIMYYVQMVIEMLRYPYLMNIIIGLYTSKF